MLKAGLDAKEAAIGQQARRRRGGAGRRGEAGRGGLRRAVPRARDDGADELHGAIRRRQVEIWVADAERRRLAGRRGGGRGREAGDVEVNKLHLGGGFGRRGAAGLSRQAVLIAKQMPGTPGQADLDARRGHAARLLSPDHAMQTARRARCGGQSGRAAHAHLPASRSSPYLMPQRMKNGVDQVAFQGWTDGRVRLQHRSRTC